MIATLSSAVSSEAHNHDSPADCSIGDQRRHQQQPRRSAEGDGDGGERERAPERAARQRDVGGDEDAQGLGRVAGRGQAGAPLAPSSFSASAGRARGRRRADRSRRGGYCRRRARAWR